jgi:hypothetical protein
LSPIWARFSTEYLFYYVFRFIRVFGILLFLAKILLKPNFQLFKPGLWAFFRQLIVIDNLSKFRVFSLFWGEFTVFFLANYLLVSLQNNRYSVPASPNLYLLSHYHFYCLSEYSRSRTLFLHTEF